MLSSSVNLKRKCTNGHFRTLGIRLSVNEAFLPVGPRVSQDGGTSVGTVCSMLNEGCPAVVFSGITSRIDFCDLATADI